MDAKTFRLLKIINKKIEFSIKKSRMSNSKRVINENELFRRLEYLLNSGFVSKINGKYTITERGYFVIQFDTWQDYLKYIKDSSERNAKKAMIDLRISEFQIRAKYWPYIISLLSFAFSIFAIFYSPIQRDKKKNISKEIHIPKQNKQQGIFLARDTIHPSDMCIDDANIGKIEASK